MKKFTFLLLALILAISPLTAFAAAPTVISYERAVQLALSNMVGTQATDIHIREIQHLRDDLQTHITSQERRQTTQATQDALHDLNINLRAADVNLGGAISQQHQLNAAAADAMAIFSNALQNNIFDADSLETAITSMIMAANLEVSIAAMQEGHTHLLQTVNDTHAIHNPARYVIDNNRRDLSELDRQMLNLRLGQEHDYIIGENALRIAIITLEELSLAVYITETAITVAEESLRQARILHDFGLLSINDLRAAEQSLTQSHMELAELNLYKSSARQHLNHMLNQPLHQHTIVEFDRYLPELPGNITRHITQTVAATQIVQQLQLQVESARYARRTFDENRDRERRANQNAGRAGETETVRRNNDRIRDNLTESYNLAVATLAQTTQALQTAMHHGYNELELLHNRKDIQILELENANTRLATALTNFELGRATSHEVEQARLSAFTAEQAMETTLNQKWLLAFMLENPALLF